MPGCRIDFNRSRNPAVVEEVKIRPVLPEPAPVGPSGRGRALEHAALLPHRQGRVIDRVVHGNRQKIPAITQKPADFRFKRQEAPAVLRDFRPVQVHNGMMRHRIAAQNHALPLAQIGRNLDIPLVKHPAVMIPQTDFFLHIIVGSRHRHGHGILQRPLLPAFRKGIAVIRPEAPDAAQIHANS